MADKRPSRRCSGARTASERPTKADIASDPCPIDARHLQVRSRAVAVVAPKHTRPVDDDGQQRVLPADRHDRHDHDDYDDDDDVVAQDDVSIVIR